jgi:hypothetical protein
MEGSAWVQKTGIQCLHYNTQGAIVVQTWPRALSVTFNSIDFTAILNLQLSDDNSRSEGKMVLVELMPPHLSKSTPSLESTINSLMSASHSSHGSLVLCAEGIIRCENAFVTNVALVSNAQLIWLQLFLQVGLKECEIMNGSTNRAIVVDNVASLDVGGNFILETKAIELVAIPAFTCDLIHLEHLLCFEVSAIDTSESSLSSISFESVLPLDLTEQRVESIEDDEANR